jgi:hypothetical protein
MPSEFPTSCDTHQELGSPAVSAQGVKGFNANDYKDDLCVEMLSEQDVEMLRTLWNIMTTFVDLGWGVDGVRLLFPWLLAVDNSQHQDSPDALPNGSVEEQNKNDETKGCE